jgi:hypothetical protein
VPIHLLKCAVGIEDIKHLRRVQGERSAERDGRTIVRGFTRRKPRRVAEVIGGGSIYWIIKGAIRVRQRVLGLADAVDADGAVYCEIRLDPALAPTVLAPRRPIQGWRYLAPEDAPADLDSEGAAPDDALPAHLVAELRALGLL